MVRQLSREQTQWKVEAEEKLVDYPSLQYKLIEVSQ